MTSSNKRSGRKPKVQANAVERSVPVKSAMEQIDALLLQILQVEIDPHLCSIIMATSRSCGTPGIHTCSKECHPEKLALWKSCCGSSRARSFSFCELLVADISYSRTAFVEPHWLEARGSMKNMGRKTFLEWKFEVNGNSVWTSQAPSS